MNKLENAISRIENGWCRGNLLQDGKVCALGALAMEELNIDTRLLDKDATNLEYERLYTLGREAEAEELLVSASHAEVEVYKQLNGLESTKALVDEIRTTEWHEKLCRNLGRSYVEEEMDDASIIWNYNDDASNSYEDVVETFKHAAKRLNPKV
jgi:hypothetical protein